MSFISPRFLPSVATEAINFATKKPLCNPITLLRAGQKYRMAIGKSKYGNKYGDGTLWEISDWHFADGRPAPLTKVQQIKRLKQKQEFERTQKLVEEMEEDIRNGNLQQFF
mmetsp:Transcript_7621/g.10511  ORF Transcript_7621/g.10511 Transcript_7621/m.10511 type:complete len:111 (-) Transcript_7621:177-509(-)